MTLRAGVGQEWGDRGAAGDLSVVPAMSAAADRSASNRLLTADEVAERWQVPTSHVYRLARDGRLPVVRLGRYRRFRPAEVDAFEAAGGADA